MVFKLCDELDKEKELYDFFNKILIEHLSNTVVPALLQVKEDVLIKEFVHQWKDFTILAHYLCKLFSYLVRYFISHFKG